MKKLILFCLFVWIIESSLFSQSIVQSNNQNYSFAKSSILPGIHLRDIAFDRNGNIWIISFKNDHTQKQSPLSSYMPMIYFVSKFKDGVYHTIQDSLNFSIDEISFDFSNNLWILSGRRIIKINDKSKFEIVYKLADEGLFNSLNFDYEDNVWIGGLRTGFLIFDGTSWTKFDTENSTLPTNSLTNIFIDNNNIKWITLWEKKGILKIENNQWTYFNKNDSDLLNQNFWDINKDSENNLWVGTGFSNSFATLISFDGKKWIENNPKNIDGNSISGQVRNLLTDINGNVWALSSLIQKNRCVNRILSKYDGDKWNDVDIDETLNIGDIEIDLDGNLWILTSRSFFMLND